IFVFKKSKTSSSKTEQQTEEGVRHTNDQKEPQGGRLGRRRGLHRERHFSENRLQVGRRRTLLGKAPEGGREAMLLGGSGGDHPQ
ncbi:hypothetical protein NPIL_112391, partial [Nephila pilipes]